MGAFSDIQLTGSIVGKDTVGIIARVCTYLAENGINILDISQTIVQGYFNMMTSRHCPLSGNLFGILPWTKEKCK